MTKSTSDSFMAKIMQRLRSLTDRQMIYILIGLGAAVVVLIGVFAFVYYRDRYAVPATPNLGTTGNRLAHLEEMIRTDPNNLELRMTVAQGYFTMQRYPDAVAQTGEVLKIQEGNKAALQLRALANLQLGEKDAALADLQRIIDLGKDAPMAKMDQSLELAYYYIGMLYNQAGRYAEALPLLKKALEINLGDADAWLELGRANAGVGQHQEAIAAFHQVVMYVPDYMEAYQGMEKSYRALNQIGLADYAKGMALFGNKDYPKAATALEAVIEQYPDVVDAYLGVGLAYERLGERDKAIKALEYYTAANPGDIAAEQALARIRRGGQ
jgi:tetratricopeptide (TPR) repeat protein